MTLNTKCLVCATRLSKHDEITNHRFKSPVTFEERAEAILDQLTSDDIAERYEGIINAMSTPTGVQEIIRVTAESTFERFVTTEVNVPNV